MDFNIFKIEEQKKICIKYNIPFFKVLPNDLIAIGKNFDFTLPINGLRHPKNEKLSGWYIWSGNDFDINDDDFFNPIHVYHIIEKTPYLYKYLGISPGNRFLIAENGNYEDIWEDLSLLNI